MRTNHWRMAILDLGHQENAFERGLTKMVPRIAVIGAGITGLRIAQKLSDVADVDVFEKSRGLGGRMSTRRAGGFQFDHGAQYFTAQTQEFQQFLAVHLAAGHVSEWRPRVVTLNDGMATPLTWTAPRYVAVPGMTELCKAMALGCRIRSNERVIALQRTNGSKWRVETQAGFWYDGYDWVISSAPSVQTQALMPQMSQQGFEWEDVQMQGCYSLMLGFAQTNDLPWDAAVVPQGPIRWIACDSSKPARAVASATSILCQTDNAWAETHMEANRLSVQEQIGAEFERLTALRLSDASYVSLHRWRYAKVIQSASLPFVLDAENQLAAAGDWFGAGRVEAGFESGSALADAMMPLLADAA